MERRPGIKATQIQSSLAVAEQLARERVARLHAAMGADTLGTIRGAIKTSWVPVEADIALAHAVESVCGFGTDYERSRRATAASLDQKLLRPFIEGVRKVFGLSPKGLFKTCQRGWNGVYKDCGQPQYVDLGERAAALDFSEMPLQVLDSDIYLRAIAGGLHALLDICHVEGEIVAKDVDARARTVRFQIEWR